MFSVLNLHFSMHDSLINVIHHRLRNQKNIVKAPCQNCGQTDGLVAYSRINEAPFVLVLHLDRTACNKECVVDIPTDLLLGEEHEGYAVTKLPTDYTLRAVINRQDCSTGEAKFTASLRLPGKLANTKKKWFLVDNSNIVRVQDEQGVCPRTTNIVIYERVW